MNHDKRKYHTGIVRFISFSLSLIFGLYGVVILFTPPSAYLIVFSTLMISYFAGISALLIMTHKKLIRKNQIEILKKANASLSVVLPLAWFIGCLDLGIISSQEFGSVIFVAICSAISWYGVSVSIKNNIKLA